MKNKIVIVVVVLLLLAGGWWMSQKKNGGVNNNQNTAKNGDKIEEKTGSGLASLKDLLTLGKDQKCQWESSEEGNKTTGTLWIKGNKFRQTITNKIDDRPETKTEVISDGEWFYLWNPESKEQGMKMKMSEEDKQENNKIANGAIDWGKQFNYNCSPASVNETDVTPPTDVKFIDLQDLQNQFKDLIPSGTQIPEN